MGLTADEKKLLEELTRRSQEPDADEDFEIEIFDGNKGTRIPFRHGKKWLEDNFGISIGDAPAEPVEGGQGEPADGGVPVPKSYFGKKATGTK